VGKLQLGVQRSRLLRLSSKYITLPEKKTYLLINQCADHVAEGGRYHRLHLRVSQ